MSQVNESKFKVIESHGNIAIREYTPLLVTEVRVEGEPLSSNKFQMIADSGKSGLSCLANTHWKPFPTLTMGM